MPSKSSNRSRPIRACSPTRAYCKIIGISGLLGVSLGAVITLVSEDRLNDLRRHLTLWLIIGIIAAINIATFLAFILSRTAYRWIKRDLEPQDEDEFA